MGRQLLGLREYARYREARGLPGITLRAVQKAIESGRITTVVDENGKPKIDAEVADIQWGRNTDPDQSARANAGRDVAPPPSGGHGVGTGAGGSGSPGGEREGSLYWDAKTRREIAEAAKAELQLEEMSGGLVKRDAVERAAYEAGRLLRDMILSVPSGLATELAAMAEPQAIEARMRDELRKVLDNLTRLTRTGLEKAKV